MKQNQWSAIGVTPSTFFYLSVSVHEVTRMPCSGDPRAFRRNLYNDWHHAGVSQPLVELVDIHFPRSLAMEGNHELPKALSFGHV